MFLDLSRAILLAPSFATSSPGCITISILGILCHRCSFIRGEHHFQAPIYCGLWVLLSIFTPIALLFAPGSKGANGYGFIEATQVVAAINSAFFGALFGSIIVYRVFQHPLRDFDGPRLAAVSKLWHVSRMFTTENHLFLESLRAKHGNIVRTGKECLIFMQIY